MHHHQPPPPLSPLGGKWQRRPLRSPTQHDRHCLYHGKLPQMTEPSTPPVSVVICTWNRSRLLRLTLEQMTKLDVPAGTTWELIVVNNNCSDDTDRVLEEFRDRLPLVRLTESKPGKSHAANLAVL